jgi:hypothetical protein
MKPMCRHCQKVRSNRPRGLCWTCYYTPGVRDLYPSTSKFARRGVGNFCGTAPLPDAATDAVPGTEEKILILMERAAKRQALFHPADNCTAVPVLQLQRAG